jgi:hypothetical protein
MVVILFPVGRRSRAAQTLNYLTGEFISAVGIANPPNLASSVFNQGRAGALLYRAKSGMAGRWQRHLQSAPPKLQKSCKFGISPAQNRLEFIGKSEQNEDAL